MSEDHFKALIGAQRALANARTGLRLGEVLDLRDYLNREVMRSK
jgi:hypothetical protein